MKFTAVSSLNSFDFVWESNFRFLIKISGVKTTGAIIGIGEGISGFNVDGGDDIRFTFQTNFTTVSISIKSPGL